MAGLALPCRAGRSPRRAAPRPAGARGARRVPGHRAPAPRTRCARAGRAARTKPKAIHPGAERDRIFRLRVAGGRRRRRLPAPRSACPRPPSRWRRSAPPRRPPCPPSPRWLRPAPPSPRRRVAYPVAPRTRSWAACAARSARARTRSAAGSRCGAARRQAAARGRCARAAARPLMLLERAPDHTQAEPLQAHARATPFLCRSRNHTRRAQHTPSTAHPAPPLTRARTSPSNQPNRS